MKFLPAIFTLMAFTAIAQDAAQTQCHWTAVEHDFGAISEDDGPVSCSFALVNDGPGELAIISTRATCGCTTPTYPRESIAPGDTAFISVTFDPTGRPGQFSKQVYVEATGLPSKARLDVRGVVIGSESTVARRFPVDMGPLKLSHDGIMLGEVKKGHLKTVYTDGYNRSDSTLTVRITRKPMWLDVVLAPEKTPAGELATFVSYVNSAKCPLYGFVEDSITISPVPGMEFTIPVTLVVKEDFSTLSAAQMRNAPRAVFGASTVDLGRIRRSGDPISRPITLRNGGKDKLEIRRVYSTDPGISATTKQPSLKRGQETQITITVDPAMLQGALLNSRLTVITNDPLSPEQTIRIVGIF